jgi:hypothetical protein
VEVARCRRHVPGDRWFVDETYRHCCIERSDHHGTGNLPVPRVDPALKSTGFAVNGPVGTRSAACFAGPG